MQLVTTWQNHESILIAMMLLYHGGYSGTTWIYNHFPSHIKYFGSHIAIVPTKFWNNCNLLGGLTTQAQQWLNFDAVLADFPLAYKHSNLNFRHCILVQPSSKLAAEASIMIRSQEQAYLHQIKAQTQQQTFLHQTEVQRQVVFEWKGRIALQAGHASPVKWCSKEKVLLGKWSAMKR